MDATDENERGAENYFENMDVESIDGTETGYTTPYEFPRPGQDVTQTEDQIITALQVDTDQLPKVYCGKLENLQCLKDAMTELLDTLFKDNKELDKRCDKLQRNFDVDTEKLLLNENTQKQLQEDLFNCRQILEERKHDIQRLEDEGIYLGLDIIRATTELTSSILEKHLEIKSESCLSNGTNTLLFRSGEFKTEIESLESELASYRAEFFQGNGDEMPENDDEFENSA